MATPAAATDFLALVRKSGVLDEKKLREHFPVPDDLPRDPHACATVLLRAGLLTSFQANQLLAGKYRGFLLGAYKVLQPIGKGGMGAVFLGEHTGLKRRVALKVLPADKAADKLTLERFQREARASAALDHPNIVRLHDISQGCGVHFLVLEYVDGTDLQSLMAKTGPLHYAQAAQYVAQAAAGLHHAHERGFVHRDIKPANLMLAKDGVIKILDMGLTRSFLDAGDDLTGLLGDASDVAGTADYIAPEQAMNKPIDERSDIYSLGATLFSLVTGHPPFKGSTAQKLMQHQIAEPPSLFKLRGIIPQALSDVVAKMMAKRASDRYQSAAEVIDALGPWLPAPTTGNIVQDPFSTAEMRAARSSPTTSTGQHTPAPPPNRRLQPLWIGVGVAATVLVVALGALAWALFGGERKTSEITRSPSPSTTQPTQTPTPAPQPLPKPPTMTGNGKVASTPTGATRGLVYKLDTSRLAPFRKQISFDTSFSGANIRGEVPGWQYEVWDKSSEGEVAAIREGGEIVLAIGSRSGQNAAQFTFQPLRAGQFTLRDSEEYEARIEYQTDGDIAGAARVQTVGDWVIHHTVQLPTSTAWRVVKYPVTRPQGKEIQLTFGTSAVGSGFLKIRSFELVAKTAPITAAPLLQFDLAGLMPFRKKYQDGTTDDGSSAINVVDKGFALCWKKSSVAEFRAEVVVGTMAIGVTNLNDDLSSQIGFHFSTSDLAKGKKYVATVEYLTQNEAFGELVVQTQGDYQRFATGKLAGTSGDWATVELPFIIHVTASGATLIIENGSIGEGNNLFVRKIAIYPVGE